MKNILYLVVPCYNEEEVLKDTAEKLKNKYAQLIEQGAIDKRSRIMFVNDGSKDSTLEIMKELHQQDKLFSYVNLSRNRGHQNALLAGLYVAAEYADMTISIDADLQDDINAIDKMVEEYQKGSEIVYGVRSSRKKDTFFKRVTAEGFYKVMKKMGVETVFNHADFRLMSKKAVQGLMQFEEVNLYLRGIVPQIGYKTSVVEYERGKRLAGESKYPLKKMLKLAFEGITSFSTKPLGMIVSFSLFLLFVSFCSTVTTAILFGLSIVPVWPLLISVMGLFTGIITLCVGIVGQYVGKNYLETKRRPRFIIDEVVNDD